MRLVGARHTLEVLEERGAAEVRERAPDVGLKEHDDGKADVGREIADDPVHRLEIEPAGDEEQADEKAGAERHLHGACAADEQQQLVNEHRDQHDVDDVPPGHGGAPK